MKYCHQKPPKMKKPINNLVAKYANIYNKAVTMRDKKKDYKRKEKHTKSPHKGDFSFANPYVN